MEKGSDNKLKRAAQLLFFKSHRNPGVKGWELKKALGQDYIKVLRKLEEKISELGLTIKMVSDNGEQKTFSDPSEVLSSCKFFISIKDPLTITDLRTSGWSIDEIAGLTICITTIISKEGKATRQELEQILSQKLPKWKTTRLLSKYVKAGYLDEKEEYIILGWRTKSEVDLENIIKYIFS